MPNRRRNKSKLPALYRGRRLFLMLVLLAGIAVLMVRAAYIDLFQQDWLQKQSDKRQVRVVKVPPYRGVIVDRNGEHLAISSPVSTLVINPKKFFSYVDKLQEIATTDEQTDAELAKIKIKLIDDNLAKTEDLLNLDAGELMQRLIKVRHKGFYRIARQLPPELAHQIVDLEIPEVTNQKGYRRFYPMAESAAHVLGFTDIDDKGIEGIEYAFNEHLAGKAGKKRVIRDGRGRLVESIKLIEPMISGKPLQLSVDLRIQYAAYKALKKRVYQLKAKSGSVVVLDTKTGEILAMANLPAFNPNHRKNLNSRYSRNRVVADAFEPGSTIKPITIAAALESRVIGNEVDIETSPGKLKIGNTTVKDPRDFGALSLDQILAKSSNVGASKVALLMEPKEHWKFLSRIGFGRKPGAGFSSEVDGALSYHNKWGEVDRASHGYGYGFSASLLQLASAYSVFGNSGVLNVPTILKQNESSNGQKVMSENNAYAVLNMMRSVVIKSGTGSKAQVEGYTVAGKTGTAFKYINKKYRKDRRVVSFIGVAPATNPRLVVAVMLDEAKVDKATGGKLAAPLFATIMTDSLRILDTAPDAIKQVNHLESDSTDKTVNTNTPYGLKQTLGSNG